MMPSCCGSLSLDTKGLTDSVTFKLIRVRLVVVKCWAADQTRKDKGT